jgi:hypothetical protein
MPSTCNPLVSGPAGTTIGSSFKSEIAMAVSSGSPTTPTRRNGNHGCEGAAKYKLRCPSGREREHPVKRGV